MKIKNMLKYSGLAALVMTVAVGCASAPKEEATTPETTTATQPMAAEPAKDTAASMAAQNAINEAKLAAEKARAAGAAWRDTDGLIAQAEAALKAGDYDKAIALANEARRQAEAAVAQHQAEEARLASSAASASAADSYSVVRGDSLWRISGKQEIYGNPYQWPLIYKANRDKIKDADLIYPGQVLAIARGASQADVDAAVKHAKTRGAWSVGAVEESDKAYLSK